MTNPSGEWKLIWSDEFDGAAGTPPNPAFWKYDLGGAGFGNNERQFYTDLPENVSMDGSGNLVITAREDPSGERDCHYGVCQYTSGRILTAGKVEFTYGRVEARIKLPFGQGIWPAFWMLAANIGEVGWPDSGEIDIMEFIGKEPRNVYGTVHGPGYSGAHAVSKWRTLEQDVSDDFHTFAVEWEPNVIRWYVDGDLYHTLTPEGVPGAWVYDHDFFIILNLAVGGYWPGYPDETSTFPQTLLVDYVRVYQRA